MLETTLHASFRRYEREVFKPRQVSRLVQR